MTPAIPPSRDAWELVQIARHAQRPYALDYITRLASNFVELHGDRITHDDPALVGGVGTWHGRTVLFIGQQKGRDLASRLHRNWGMLHPEGYRKAMRLARQAAKFDFPVVALVDTPGAYPGAEAEERGIASAIGTAIMQWFEIAVPVVAVIIGEGGSGGALGLAIADSVLMLENAIYSVAAPEAAASIVWRDASRRADMANLLGLTAARAMALGVIDGVVREPSGGAHLDHDRAAAELDEAVWEQMRVLLTSPRRHLLRRRRERFRRIGPTLSREEGN